MSARWTPESWQSKPILQVPTYPDADKAAEVETRLGQKQKSVTGYITSAFRSDVKL